MVWWSLSAAQDAVSSFGTAAPAMTLCILRIHVASGGPFETWSTLQSVFGPLCLHTLLYSALTHAACLQAAPRRSLLLLFLLRLTSCLSLLLSHSCCFFFSSSCPLLLSVLLLLFVQHPFLLKSHGYTWLPRAQQPIPGQHWHAVVLECFPCLPRVQHSVCATSQPSLPTVWISNSVSVHLCRTE